jgi:hypothetical protein
MDCSGAQAVEFLLSKRLQFKPHYFTLPKQNKANFTE